VNEFISLKLDNGATDIYINDEHFNQCKYLLISIPLEYAEDFDGYDTMDEIIKATNKNDGEKSAKSLTSVEEFQGHCSNIQAWVENHYDYRILDTRLSIPIILEIMKGLLKPVDKERFRKFFLEVVQTLDDYIINSLNNEATWDKYKFLKGIVCRIRNRYFSDEEISGSILLKLIHDRFIETFIREREKRREYNRKKGKFNRWEAKLWGTGKENLKYRKFLRMIRNACELPILRADLIVSNELDYLPYLYFKGMFKEAGNISLCYLRDGTLIIRDEEGNYWKDIEKHNRGMDYGYGSW